MITLQCGYLHFSHFEQSSINLFYYLVIEISLSYHFLFTLQAHPMDLSAWCQPFSHFHTKSLLLFSNNNNLKTQPERWVVNHIRRNRLIWQRGADAARSLLKWWGRPINTVRGRRHVIQIDSSVSSVSVFQTDSYLIFFIKQNEGNRSHPGRPMRQPDWSQSEYIV